MAAVFPWARKSRFRIMIVDTTLAVSGLPRPVCAPPVETKPERRRTHPRRVPVVHDRVGLEFRIRSLNRGLGHHCVAPEF